MFENRTKNQRYTTPENQTENRSKKLQGTKDTTHRKEITVTPHETQTVNKHIQQKHEDQLKTLQTSESSLKERLIHLEKELAVLLSKIEQSEKYANELKELLAKNLSAKEKEFGE